MLCDLSDILWYVFLEQSQVSPQYKHNYHKHMATTVISVLVSALNPGISTDTQYWYWYQRDGSVGLKLLAASVALKDFMNVTLHLLQVSQSGTDGEGEHCTSVTKEMFCNNYLFVHLFIDSFIHLYILFNMIICVMGSRNSAVSSSLAAHFTL